MSQPKLKSLQLSLLQRRCFAYDPLRSTAMLPCLNHGENKEGEQHNMEQHARLICCHQSSSNMPDWYLSIQAERIMVTSNALCTPRYTERRWNGWSHREGSFGNECVALSTHRVVIQNLEAWALLHLLLGWVVNGPNLVPITFRCP